MRCKPKWAQRSFLYKGMKDSTEFLYLLAVLKIEKSET